MFLTLLTFLFNEPIEDFNGFLSGSCHMRSRQVFTGNSHIRGSIKTIILPCLQRLLRVHGDCKGVVGIVPLG